MGEIAQGLSGMPSLKPRAHWSPIRTDLKKIILRIKNPDSYCRSSPYVCKDKEQGVLRL